MSAFRRPRELIPYGYIVAQSQLNLLKVLFSRLIICLSPGRGYSIRAIPPRCKTVAEPRPLKSSHYVDLTAALA